MVPLLCFGGMAAKDILCCCLSAEELLSGDDWKCLYAGMDSGALAQLQALHTLQGMGGIQVPAPLLAYHTSISSCCRCVKYDEIVGHKLGIVHLLQ